MAKKTPPAPIVAPEPEAPHTPFLPWPKTPEQCASSPRTFRIHRMNAFEWQGYVTENGIEKPIGKPDVFELIEFKIKHVLRVEGQREYLAERQKRVAAQEAAHALKAAQDAKQA